MRDQIFKLTLLTLLTLGLLAVPVAAQEGTGHSGEDDEIGQGQEALKRGRRGDKMTRKEKKELKQLEKEHAEARKAQKRWEKMGLAARTAPEWYAEALTRYKAGKYLQAREILLPLEDSPRAIDIQEKVKLLVTDTYYYQGGALNLAEALARYRTFLTFYPSSEHAEYARFQMGNCYYKQLGPADRDQSYTNNAIGEYSALLRDYPNGEYSTAAKERMLEAKARRARHEFKVASFYVDWGNHAAAAARLEDLLANRPESPDREEALYLLANSLYQLGRGADAEAYAARLRTDYPGSKLPNKIRATSSGKAADALQKKANKRAKSSERTYKSQRKREDKRTRQVRKDSGLPRNVPTYADDSYQGPTSGAVATPPPAAEPTKAQLKSEKREAARQEKMLRLEEKEQDERARQLEKEASRSAQDARPKDEKQLAAEAKQAKKDAEKAKKHAERMEKAEAKEQAEAEAQAERDRKTREKREAKEAKEDAKADKKAEKKAKKGG
jgi:outer membrane protein assembly factor BamD